MNPFAEQFVKKGLATEEQAKKAEADRVEKESKKEAQGRPKPPKRDKWESVRGYNSKFSLGESLALAQAVENHLANEADVEPLDRSCRRCGKKGSSRLASIKVHGELIKERGLAHMLDAATVAEFTEELRKRVGILIDRLGLGDFCIPCQREMMLHVESMAQSCPICTKPGHLITRCWFDKSKKFNGNPNPKFDKKKG